MTRQLPLNREGWRYGRAKPRMADGPKTEEITMRPEVAVAQKRLDDAMAEAAAAQEHWAGVIRDARRDLIAAKQADVA